MHERQAAIAVITILFFSVMYTSESFAQVPQCNGQDATIVGTEDKDKIRGTSGDDVIVGLGGNDVIYGKGGNDVICGGEGYDRLFGNSGNDVILGEKDSDKLYGGQGIDTCDSSSDDRRVIGCETPYIQSIVSDTSDDLQKQLAELQAQINNMILGFSSWSDIQGIPESLADGDDDTLGNIKCDAEQTLVFNGNSWVCSNQLENIPMDSTCNGNLVNFEGLSHGAGLNQIQEKLAPFGITLTATGNGKSSIDTVIIYDSNIDDGNDSDLEVNIGNLAIIPDKIEDPSDSAKGGQQVYEFNPPSTVQSLIIVDTESDEAGTITAYDEDGEVIKSIKLPATGNKAYTEVTINAPNVAKLEIDYDSSGGLTNICFSENDDEAELECEANQILVYDGNEWICDQDKDLLADLVCNTDEIVKWNGNDWKCFSNQSNTTTSPLFFHSVLISSAGLTSWVGPSAETRNSIEMDVAAVTMPSNGTIGNLFARTGEGLASSPGQGHNFTLTLLINDGTNGYSPTLLSCTISDNEESCLDAINSVSVNAGDAYVLRVEPTPGSPSAVVMPSLQITVP